MWISHAQMGPCPQSKTATAVFLIKTYDVCIAYDYKDPKRTFNNKLEDIHNATHEAIKWIENLHVIL